MSQINGKFILNNTITLAKLSNLGAELGNFIRYDGSAWSLFKRDFLYSTNAVQNIATTTPTTITQLTSESLSVGTYKIKTVMVCQSTSVFTGVGLRLNQISSVINIANLKWRISQAANGTDKEYLYDQIGLSTNIFSTLSSAANSNFLAIGEGVFNITTAGTVAIQMRSDDGTSVSVRPNSFMIIERLT